MTHPLPSSSSLSSALSASSHLLSGFPGPAWMAPATFTSASAPAHASSPSHPSTCPLNALSAPNSSKPAQTAAAAAASSSSSSQPSLQQPPPPPPSPAPLATATVTATTTGSPCHSHDPKVLPYLFDDAQLDDVLVLVVDMLVKLTKHNDSLPLHPSALTRFHSRATPNITLSAYLRRIAKYTSIEKCCLLILLVYIDRVCERLDGFTISGLTVHRFICAAILCASKALCDAFNTNEHYAKVGGISLQEINLLEKEFLQIIDWRLICSGAVLQHYYASLVRSHSDYVLAEPPVAAEVHAVAFNGSGSGELNGQSSASSGGGIIGDGIIGGSIIGSSSGSSASRNGSTSTAGAGLTLAMASSQHSSPFPISSTSASPFTPAGVNVLNAGLVAGNASTASGSGSGSSTSPLAAMQFDSDPHANAAPPSAAVAAPAAMNRRRRKDEQRTPPSPPSLNAHSSSEHASNTDRSAFGSNGNGYRNAAASAQVSTTQPYQHPAHYQDEAHKRIRFGYQSPPPPSSSQQQQQQP
ncbi:related to PHO80-cyclin [Ustilago bromivora]|uniref:Related to PHO80 - cyclin n=1 Tax=Ustilago bromivora TaxID=307758 RepID=A0A1K0GLW9_9BASI|nr:related to PHO80-cyclin [Ustilago bromivora]SYW84039.1 related to PHO80 - cyclin [Ustilago bromivora]